MSIVARTGHTLGRRPADVKTADIAARVLVRQINEQSVSPNLNHGPL
jgi:hypothetical protein